MVNIGLSAVLNRVFLPKRHLCRDLELFLIKDGTGKSLSVKWTSDLFSVDITNLIVYSDCQSSD